MTDQPNLDTAALAIADPGERAAAESLAALTTAPAPQGAATGLLADPAYQAAMERALAAKTSAATSAAVAEMERIALQRFPTDPGAPAAEPNAMPEGLDGGELREYIAPPEAARQISDPQQHSAIIAAAQAAGVPPGFYAQAMTEAADKVQLLNDGAGYDAAIVTARETLAKLHGGGEHKAVIQDALAYFGALEKAQPALAESIDLMLTSPWAIATAARMQRAGAKPR